jgi:hypothetical protein
MGLGTSARAFTAVLAVALVGLIAFAASASALPTRFWGVVPQAAPSEEQTERLQRGGVRTMRVAVDWGGLQVGGRSEPIVWSGIDAIVERAAKNNIEVLPFLTGAPNWAVPSVYVPGDRNAKAPAHLPAGGAAATAWSKFVKEAVARYGSTGSFWAQNPAVPKKPIRVWQIWNEPNFKYFVAKPNPAEYGRLVKLSATAIKSVDRSGEVLLAGLFSYPKGCLKEKRPKSPCATDFLEQMYKRTPGIKNRFQWVALHPYTAKYQELNFAIEEFRDTLKANKDAGKGLWITELGWSSMRPDPARNVFAKGPAGQAAQLKGSFTLLRNRANKWKLQRLYWFSVDDAVGTCNFCDGSGLFGDGFIPKRSWYQYVRFAGGTP